MKTLRAKPAERLPGARFINWKKTAAPTAGFFWLTAFYVVYCARPEDWIPGLTHIPPGEDCRIFALLGIAYLPG